MPPCSCASGGKIKAAVLVLFCVVSAVYFTVSKGLTVSVHSQRGRARQTARRPARYTQFPHNIKAHSIECASCHKFPSPNWNKVRIGDAAFPDITDYPTHQSCVNCHKQQFYRGAQPAICSICHINASPRDGRRYPFPNPREIFDQSAKGRTAVSDFAIHFPHDKHIGIVTARNSRPAVVRNVALSYRPQGEESCAVCHTTYRPQGDSADEYVTSPPADLGERFWLKKGTFKTSPIGHQQCFNCHTADSGLEPEPKDCAVCHKIRPPPPPADFDPKIAAAMKVTDKITLDAWRRRDSSGTYRHEWFSHAELSCSTCHNVDAMNTLDPATKRVRLTSCSMCHATATAEEGGALNIEVAAKRASSAFQCTKCHLVYGRQLLPDSHLKALAAATGN